MLGVFPWKLVSLSAFYRELGTHGQLANAGQEPCESRPSREGLGSMVRGLSVPGGGRVPPLLVWGRGVPGKPKAGWERVRGSPCGSRLLASHVKHIAKGNPVKATEMSVPGNQRLSALGERTEGGSWPASSPGASAAGCCWPRRDGSGVPWCGEPEPPLPASREPQSAAQVLSLINTNSD